MNTAEARQSADTIRRQVGVFGLGVVGAHDLGFTEEGGLTFKARLHYTGQTRVRVMRVTITPNASDYYDVQVVHADKWGETQRTATWSVMCAWGLTDLMYRIDSEGI